MASSPLHFRKPSDDIARYLPPRPNFVAPQKSAKVRRRLWDFSPHLHCSIIGTCLTTSELRRILVKAHGEQARQLSDHEIHKDGVRLANMQGGPAKLLNKALDERHSASIHRFASARTSEEVLQCWRSARADGDIPGGYWAALTHPELLETHLTEIFGDVHMLSHLVGAANRADIRRLTELERDNAKLHDKIERQQARCQQIAAEREEVSRELDELRLQVRFDCRPTTNDHVSEMAMELDRLARIYERERERSAKLERERDLIKEERSFALQHAETLARSVADLQLEVSALEEFLAPRDNGGARIPQHGARTILYVGGRQTLIPVLRSASAGMGMTFLHHDGGQEHAASLLPNLIAQADEVFFPVDCISHGAMSAIKKHCKDLRKPFRPLRRSSLGSFVDAARSPVGTIAQ